MQFTRTFIQSVIPEASFQGSDFPQNPSFSVDSRTINSGEIFIAVNGLRTDGHDFVRDAVKRGASGLVISHSKKNCIEVLDASSLKKLSILIVADPVQAIIALATKWRSKFDFPVIGITGSIGKTSTKELVAHIIKLANKKCLSSSGNQNTMLGAAINILKMDSSYEVAVFEMGINKRGEMAMLASMIRPTVAVITAVGHSHMEGLGSVYDIASEKRDIFKYFKEDNIGIINGDNAILSTISYNHPIVKFGCKMTNQIQARKVHIQGANTHYILKLYKERHRVSMPTSHVGPIMNGLAATAVSYVLGIPANVIIEGLQSYTPFKSRFETRKLKQHRGVMIDDCYNANPESMKAALLAFENLEARGKKIAVLGDMLGLGVNAPFWHRQLGRFLRKVSSLQHVVFVGENVKWAQKTMPGFITCEIVPAWKDAIECLSKFRNEEIVVLVKGSNPMELKNLVHEMAE